MQEPIETDKVNRLMDLMRNSKELSWVAEQLSSTFEEGVSINAKKESPSGTVGEEDEHDDSFGLH